METYHFRIADIPFQIQIEWPVEMTDNFLPFLTEKTEDTQEKITFICREELPKTPEPKVWSHGRGETELDGKRCILHRLSDTLEPFLAEFDREENDRVFCIRKKSGELPVAMYKVFNTISMEDFFLNHDALLLHTSLIRWEGKGILFSAPSGTGKSTQADLWAKYCGAEIINGDRAVLRKIDGVWTAFGLPFAGSSDIFKNESVPITAVVMLAQGKENILEPLTPAQAIKKILPEVTLHRWDEAFLNKGLDLILNLLGEVSVYRLSCRPDREAVELLRKTITKEVWK